MALSYALSTGNGSTTNYTFDKGYLENTHVYVFVDGVLKAETTDYTWFNPTTIQFLVAPVNGALINLSRSTPNITRLIDFQDAGNLTAQELDDSALQNFYIAQEGKDQFDDLSMQVDLADNKWDGESRVLKDLADPVNAQDAVTKNWAETDMASSVAEAAASAAAALVSENAADASETASAASAAAALASEGVATSKAAVATTQASAAATSAAEAAADELLTNADAIATAADALATAADLVLTDADTVATAADVVSTNADVVLTNADVTYADEWATKAEDSLVSVAAGADGVTDYSALHWAAKASASAASVDTAAMTNTDDMVCNGSMQVSQRASSFVSPAHLSLTLDQWAAYDTSTGSITVSKVIAGATAGHEYSLNVVVTGTDTPAGSEHVAVAAIIEGSDMAHLGWGSSAAKSVALQFKTAHSKVGTYSVALVNPSSTQSYIVEYTQSVANTWESHSVVIPGSTTTSWATTTLAGMHIVFSIATGSTRHGAADTWISATDYATAASVNGMDSVSNIFRFGAVALQTGSVVTTLITKTYDQVLQKCKRYYEKSYDQLTYAGAITTNGSAAVLNYALGTGVRAAGMTVPFQVEKANAPTVTTYSPSTGTVGKAYDGAAAADLSTTVAHKGQNSYRWHVTVPSSINYDLRAHWTAESLI